MRAELIKKKNNKKNLSNNPTSQSMKVPLKMEQTPFFLSFYSSLEQTVLKVLLIAFMSFGIEGIGYRWYSVLYPNELNDRINSLIPLIKIVHRTIL